MTTNHTPTRDAIAARNMTTTPELESLAREADRQAAYNATRATERALTARVAELEAALRKIAEARPSDVRFDAYEGAQEYQRIARAALAKS